MTGRRVGSIAEIEQPGDYCGPSTEYTGDLPAVFYTDGRTDDGWHGYLDEGHTWRQA